jgi:hypothetical protein
MTAASPDFFFEKKKQKNYVEPGGTQERLEHCGPHFFLSAARLNIIKSFLVLFFKKELLASFLTLPAAPPRPSADPR